MNRRTSSAPSWGRKFAPELIDAACAEIIVEVVPHRAKNDGFDPCLDGSGGKRCRRALAGGIGVHGDVELAQRGGKHGGGEIACGERGDHRQGGQNAAQRQDGFDALAGCHDVLGDAEAHGMGPDVAERAPGILDRRFAVVGAAELRVEPSPMDAGDPVRQVGDGGNERRPLLDRRVRVRAVEAGGVETEGIPYRRMQ